MKNNLKLPPEWEKQQATILAMPHEQSDWKNYLEDARKKVSQIASNIAKYQKVFILCNDDESIESVYKYTSNQHSIKTISVKINDTWCRDYMPLGMIKNSKLLMIDFVFNGWGLKHAANFDNQASQVFCNEASLKIKSKKFILEGGSIDVNGNGLLLTTSKCLLSSNRNNMSKQKVDSKLKKYLRINKILWLDNGFLMGDDTDCHVDNLARFINEETIICLECDNKNDPHFHNLMAMKQELKKYCKKHNLTLISMPMPSAIYYKNQRLPASYINFLFINNAILIPVFNDKNDQIAISTFKSLCPSRDVIPIDSRILIRQGGSIHCMSMQIPKI